MNNIYLVADLYVIFLPQTIGMDYNIFICKNLVISDIGYSGRSYLRYFDKGRVCNYIDIKKCRIGAFSKNIFCNDYRVYFQKGDKMLFSPSKSYRVHRGNDSSSSIEILTRVRSYIYLAAGKVSALAVDFSMPKET